MFTTLSAGGGELRALTAWGKKLSQCHNSLHMSVMVLCAGFTVLVRFPYQTVLKQQKTLSVFLL